jgi:hypothetical protein
MKFPAQAIPGVDQQIMQHGFCFLRIGSAMHDCATGIYEKSVNTVDLAIYQLASCPALFPSFQCCNIEKTGIGMGTRLIPVIL